MKIHKFLMSPWGFLAILTVGAFVSQSAVSNEEPDASKPKSKLSDTEMEAMLLDKAAGNHTLEFLLSQQMDAEEWSETIDRMIDYGADINPEEKAAIIEWFLNR